MGKVLGAGKYGVVKEAHNVGKVLGKANPNKFNFSPIYTYLYLC